MCYPQKVSDVVLASIRNALENNITPKEVGLIMKNLSRNSNKKGVAIFPMKAEGKPRGATRGLRKKITILYIMCNQITQKAPPIGDKTTNCYRRKFRETKAPQYFFQNGCPI